MEELLTYVGKGLPLEDVYQIFKASSYFPLDKAIISSLPISNFTIPALGTTHFSEQDI